MERQRGVTGWAPRRDGSRPGPARAARGVRGPRLANTRRRGRALFVATLFVFSVFAAQLVRLQGLEAAAIAQDGRSMRMGDSDILPAIRGRILDTHGVVLAEAVERDDVIADPLAIQEYTVKQGKEMVRVGATGAAEALSPVLGMSVGDLMPLLTGNTRYRVVKKGLEPLQWRKVAALGIPGISKVANQRRVYPGGSALAPIVGWVGTTGQAKNGDGGGLELLYDAQLTGTPGKKVAEYGADGRQIPMAGQEITPAIPGRDVRLTIDADLQWYAYNAIAAQVQAMDAASGFVVVMDRQGHLRAVAQYPSFDPVIREKDGVYGALPFQYAFEPGSTAKMMSVGAALNEHLITPTTPLTVPWTAERSDQVLKDMHPHGVYSLTPTGVLAVSSNVGAILIGEKMSTATIDRYYRAFGMGAGTAVGFPGETAGLLAAPGDVRGSQRYTMLYGQGFSVNAVQIAGAYQALANGGQRISPTLLEGSTGPDGRFTPAGAAATTQVLDPETARTLLAMMENVTAPGGGTAVAAQLPGYRVAGKTGTGDQNLGRPDHHNTMSFIGITPADDPRLICAVVVNRPNRTNSSSEATAPVFTSVMTYALQRDKIPPTGAVGTPYPNWWGAQASQNVAR